jgi:hypothetical protein
MGGSQGGGWSVPWGGPGQNLHVTSANFLFTLLMVAMIFGSLSTSQTDNTIFYLIYN